MFRRFTHVCFATAAILAVIPGSLVAQTPACRSRPKSVVSESLNFVGASADEDSIQQEQLVAARGIRGFVAVGVRLVVDITTNNGLRTAIPKIEKLATGIELNVQPTISADRRFVQLTVKGNVKSVDDSTPPFPVVMTVEPTEKSNFDAVVFTQYVQQPKAQTLSVDETFTAPVGHTFVIDAGTRTHAVHKTSKVAVLGDLPLLQCLFSKESTVQEEEHVLILVTPRIVGESK
jgi:type II secretory pathway component HofQ